MTASIETLLQSPPLAGAVARSGKTADRIDGVRPRLVVEPRSDEEVATLLAWATRERLTVVFRGGGTKLGWGRVPGDVDLLVSMRGLNRVLAHDHADLTASVEAGATIDEVNAALGRHRQWLPLDPAGEGATIGGAIATNDSGPLRHRYGTPRDLLIGVRLATADGRLVKSGGNVVKNVAGYDLGKLLSGSCGTLAAIVGATFKLLPVPAASQTLIARFETADETAAAVTRLSDSDLDPMAVEIQSPPYTLLVRLATSPAATTAQADQARALVGTGEVVSDEAEGALWRRYQGRPSASAGTMVRLSWLPAALPQVLAAIEELNGPAGTVAFAARAAIGAGLLRLEGSSDWQASVVDRLRARGDLLRHVTIQDAPPEVKAMVDAWGSLGPAGVLGTAIKRALDPAGILNASRGPI